MFGFARDGANRHREREMEYSPRLTRYGFRTRARLLRAGVTKERHMKRALFRGVVGLALAAGVVSVQASERDARDVTLAVTMTNDAAANAIRVYDTATHQLLQTSSTRGKGGVTGNARGIKADGTGEWLAAVNNGSGTVAVFSHRGDRLVFEQVVTTTSAPVSIDFGNDHMYVAGSMTVDSFPIRHGRVGARDGTTFLELADGSVPPAGSTAQVGVLTARSLLVTLKTDPSPGTVDIVRLDEDGAVRNVAPRAVSAPDGTLTPFGFSVYADGTAVITLAHSAQDGLFRGGKFTDVIAAGQSAPCWMTSIGKYVFTANTGSGTISRLLGSGNNIFVDDPVAARITTGGSPSDIDADASVLGVLDRVAGEAHLSLFTYNAFGELAASGSPIAIGAAGANGIAIVRAADHDDR
jgi:hypothetical protein